MALFTVQPGAGGGGTEVSGGSYARISVTNNTTNFPTPTGDLLQNGAAITFAAATANWGTIVAWALMDASTGGNVYITDLLTSSITINSGSQFQFLTNSIQITL